jgi:hypothetical protein
MVTLSAGIAFTPEHGSTESELLKAADEAMYTAKQGGRNRIVVYQKEPRLSSLSTGVDETFPQPIATAGILLTNNSNHMPDR